MIITASIPTLDAYGILMGAFFSPTEEDWNEVVAQTSHINNNTLRFMLQNQLIYCPHLPTCSNTYTRRYRSQFVSCCEGCSCSESCLQFGNCCPSFLVNHTADVQYAGTHSKSSCELPQLTKRTVSGNVKQTYFMVTKCRENQCKKFSMSSSSFTIPVTSVTTNKTYMSKTCAMCNNENERDLMLWESELTCHTPPVSFIFESLKKLILENEVCNIIFTPPSGAVTDKCPWGLITECNVTGDWINNDARIEFGCSAYTSIYFGIYRNVFCYMCNVAQEPHMECMISFRSQNKYPTSFSVLLDFRGVSKETKRMESERKCLQDEKYDSLMNICRQVTCSANLLYDPTTFTCKQSFSSIRAMRYRIYLKFVPLTDLPVNASERDMCSLMKEYILREFLYRSNLIEGMCSVRMFFKTRDSLDTRNCLTDNVRYFTFLFEQGITEYHNYVQHISQLLSVADMIQTIYTPDSFILFKIFIMTVNLIPYPMEGNVWWSPEDELLIEFHAQIHNLDVSFHMFCLRAPLTEVSYTTLCPRIHLNTTELIYEPSDSSMTMSSLNLTFISGEYENENGNKYLVCAENFFRKVENLTSSEEEITVREQTDIEAIEGIFSLVCTVVSIVSLLITIITYSIFNQLRTIPGKNTLGLCITLLLAHLLYPYAYKLSIDKVACAVAGISTHFFWLCSMFWMNVCCIHMFRVFKSVDQLVTLSGGTRTFICYCGYVFFGSAVFISINIGLSLHVDNIIGYGGPQCYITSPIMVLYTFALPTACIILANIIMFFIVVCKLQNTGNVDMANKSGRNNLKIYVKLSTLTGVTWIFGFLYQWLLFKPLSFAFILFAAGQGVFIMISFVCNSRIKSLYAERVVSKTMSTS